MNSLIAITCFLISCKSPVPKDVNLGADKMDLTSILYSFDSSLIRLLPDTALEFTNTKEESAYIFQYQKKFDSIFQDVMSKHPKSDSLFSLLINTLRINQYYLSKIDFNRLKKLPKNSDYPIRLLTFLYTPSVIKNDKVERLQLLQGLPKELQNSKSGEQTKEDLEWGNSVTKYHGINLYNLATQIKDTAGSKVLLSKSIKPSKKYMLLKLSTSWCRPCKVQGRQLKYWITKIDTTKFDIIDLSLDKNEEKWQQYVLEENYPWKSFLAFSDFKNPIAIKLDIKGVPMNIVLNNKGEIEIMTPDVAKALLFIDSN